MNFLLFSRRGGGGGLGALDIKTCSWYTWFHKSGSWFSCLSFSPSHSLFVCKYIISWQKISKKKQILLIHTWHSILFQSSSGCSLNIKMLIHFTEALTHIFELYSFASCLKAYQNLYKKRVFVCRSSEHITSK